MSDRPAEPRPSLPRWIARIVRILTPAELADAVVGDLDEVYGRVHGEYRPLFAFGRVLKEVFWLHPWALHRATRRLAAHSSSPRTGDGLMHALSTDLRFAFRWLRHNLGTSALMISTLALAIAGTTVLFSVVHGVLLRPLPFPESDRLIRVWQTNGAWMDSPNRQLREFAQRFPVSPPIARAWAERSTAFESIGAYTGASFRYRGEDRSEILRGQQVTSGFFEVLGVPAAVGRTLIPAEDEVGSPPATVLSHATWRDRFGSDPEIVGRTLMMNRTAYTVVGVMPPGFMFPGTGPALWASLPDDRKDEGFDSQFLSVVGRLTPGASVESARLDIGGIQRALEAEIDDQEGRGARLEPLLESVVGRVKASLWFLLGSVGLVLLVACLNIANLLFGLGLRRRKELAVRAALGAGSRGLLRGSIVESALLAAAGGGAGILLAWLTLPALLRIAPPGVPRIQDVSLNAPVLGFGVGITVLTVFLVGVLPALHATRTQPAAVLRSASGSVTRRGGTRTRRWLVISEVALAFVLLAGAGLLANSYLRLTNVDRGFTTEGIVIVSVSTDDERYESAEDGTRRLARDLRDRLARVPGVVDVTATNQVPLSGSTSSTSFEVERDGADPEEMNFLISVVLDNYFDFMRIPIRPGRAFEPSDRDDAPFVAVVSATLAERVWPGESPLGKRVRSGADEPWLTVVGVAADVRHQGLDIEPDPKLYVPVWQSGRASNQWLLRAVGDPSGILSLAREAIQEGSRDHWSGSTAVLSKTVDAAVALPRFRTLLIGGLAALAALLALLGIYGVMVFAVTERNREFGVRLALGARPDELVRSVLRGGLTLAAAGLALGLLGALSLGRVVESFLFGIEATDLLTLVVMCGVVAAVAILASWLPALRASRVDPVSVLNSE